MSTSPKFTCYIHASEAECASAQTWLDANRGDLPSVRVQPVDYNRNRKRSLGAGLFEQVNGKLVVVADVASHRTELTMKLHDLLAAALRIGVYNMCPGESTTRAVTVVESDYARIKSLYSRTICVPSTPTV